MENRYIKYFKTALDLNIKGKNINRFIQRLVNNKIDILNLKYLKYDEINIKVYMSDYPKIMKLKTVYQIKIVNAFGFLKYKILLKNNLFFITCILIGIAFLFVLSNIVFKIEIVHNNIALRQLIETELYNNNLRIGSFVKNYAELAKIKENILKKYKDNIEWLEIERVGTKYLIRVEQRIIPDNKKNDTKQHIVASKYAIIKRVVASKGQIIRNINDYVKPGDIIISGNIDLNGEIKDTVRADGKVYGEVWYETSVEYPLTYYDEKLTGQESKVLIFKLFNNQWEIFKKYKDKISTEKVILNNSLLPLAIVIDKQKEVKKIEEILTYDQAIERAVTLARDKILASLDGDEKIISEKQLKVNLKDSKIVIDIFFTVYENITMSQLIEETGE